MTESVRLIAIVVLDNGMNIWSLDADGEELSYRHFGLPISTAEKDTSDAVKYHLQEWLGEWPQVPVLVAGANSPPRTTALQVPLRIEDIGSHLWQDDNLWLVPGLKQTSPPDITNGPEICLMAVEDPSGMVCIPGKQSRHFVMDHGRLLEFTTELTGDMREALLRHPRSTPWLNVTQTFEQNIFKQWADRSLDTANALSPFAVHAACTTGQLDASLYDCALSGLLIGAEVAAHYDPGDEVTLIADGTELDTYGLAFDTLEVDVTEYSAVESLRDGLFEIADLAGLLDDRD